ncbi:MAG: thioredoxin domain-containing protein [Planctomycetes bacterium]|nr:thioredoxin domain-containing protein [Planctomycetota bacterium]
MPLPAPNWSETVTISPEDGYILGNPEAPIKLVEYASHTCGACANFAASGKPGSRNTSLPASSASNSATSCVTRST